MTLLDLDDLRVQNRAMPYLTVREAVERIGKTRQWIHSLIRRGKISAIRSENGDWLIDQDSLDAYEPGDPGRPQKKIGRPRNK